MSHAIYCSLMAIEDPGPDLINESFDAMEERLDDNNWFTHHLAVTIDGEVIPMRATTHYRSSPNYETSMLHELDHMPRSQRWDWIRHFAMRCAVSELGPGIVSGGLPYDADWLRQDSEAEKWVRKASIEEITQKILTNVPAALVKKFSDLMDERPKDFSDLEAYRTEGLARSYFLFRKSLLSWGDGEVTPPFSPSGTPYEYRCFDLTEGLAGNLILLTDIHT